MFWLRTAYGDIAAHWKGIRSDERCHTLNKFKHSWPCWQHDSIGENTAIAPLQLNLDKREGGVVSSTLHLLWCRRKNPLIKSNKRLGGLQPVWTLWRRKNVFPLQRTRPRLLVRAVQSLVTLPAGLLWAFRNRIVPTRPEDSEHYCELLLYPRTVYPNETSPSNRMTQRPKRLRHHGPYVLCAL